MLVTLSLSEHQELEQQRIAIKDMQSGESEEIALDQIAEFY